MTGYSEHHIDVEGFTLFCAGTGDTHLLGMSHRCGMWKILEDGEIGTLLVANPVEALCVGLAGMPDPCWATPPDAVRVSDRLCLRVGSPTHKG